MMFLLSEDQMNNPDRLDRVLRWIDDAFNFGLFVLIVIFLPLVCVFALAYLCC